MSKSNNSGGIGVLYLLTIVFVVLKLCNVIDWSWWWVLSPVLIPTGIGLIAAFILLIMRVWFHKK